MDMKSRFCRVVLVWLKVSEFSLVLMLSWVWVCFWVLKWMIWLCLG